MDKYEYNLKLEEIDKLVDQGDYEEAANLADTIEWRRVRNVRTLSLMSEIYEAAGKLEKSKDMLVRAYRKSPVGRNVLYRLVEVTTELGEYEEALEYFAEYVQAAPHDNNRYILKYKIYRGRGSSTEELIAILEEYLGLEYTERWAYELALLYQEAGQIQKCMATCDDLVLWFHSGKYVRKALDLKKRYAVLTPKQKQIYEVCLQEEAQSEYFEDSDEDATIFQKNDAADDEVLAENIIAETEKEIAGEITARKAEREKGVREQAASSAELSSAHAGATNETIKIEKSDTKTAPASKAEGKEQTGLFSKVFRKGSAKSAKKDTEDILAAVPSGQTRKEDSDKAAEAESEMESAIYDDTETGTDDYEEAVIPDTTEYDDLQVEMAKSVRKVISGVARKPELNEDDVPAAVEDRLRNIQEVSKRREPEPVAGKLSIDDILLAMGEKGRQTAAAARAQRESAAAQEETEGTADESRKTEHLPDALPDDTADSAMAGRDIEQKAEETYNVVGADAADAQSDPKAAEAEATDGRAVEDEESQPEAAYGEDALDVAESSDIARAKEKMESRDIALEKEEAESPDMEDKNVRKAVKPGNTVGAENMEPENRMMTAAAGEPVSQGSLAQTKSVAVAAAGELTQEQLEALRYSTNPEKFLKNRSSLPTYVSETDMSEKNAVEKASGVEQSEAAGNIVADDAGATRRFSTKEELLEAARQEIMTSKTIRIPAEEVAKAYSRRTDRLWENASSQKLSNTARRDEFVDKTADGMETATRAQNLESADAEVSDMEVSDVNVQGQEKSDGNVQKQKVADGNARDAEATDMGVQNLEAADAQGLEKPDMSDTSEDEEYFDDPLTLAPYHRGMFAGFTEVEGLEDQIANAILQAVAKGNDRTSRNGNILIFGAHGSGKTTLATNIAKAIAQEKGRQTVKMAKIYAADLNRRDIAATVAKIAGGTLIVEEAGDLADNTVEQLTTAMEFRTDGLIVILEDEQRYIHNLLMNHPRFTMKFTAQIYLPAYTVDELCMFALRHANSLDYSISEDGFEAIRQKVAQMSSTETPMSIGDVTAMVDQAIRRSNKFMRKMSMGKKRYDENDYVLLFAKDFK